MSQFGTALALRGCEQEGDTNMKHYKTLILGFIVTMAFAACGEGFKANHSAAKSATDGAAATPPASETPAATDEAVIREYGADPLSLDENNRLDQEIGAFEITTEIVSHPGGASDVLRVIKASFMGESCNSPVLNIENSTASINELQSRSRITVGTSSQYQVDVLCTNSTCSELAATLIRNRSNQGISLAFYGLVATKTETAGSTVTRTYTSRQSLAPGFSTVMGLAEKFNSCIQGPFQPVAGDPTAGDFVEQNNSQTTENRIFFPQTQAL